MSPTSHSAPSPIQPPFEISRPDWAEFAETCATKVSEGARAHWAVMAVEAFNSSVPVGTRVVWPGPDRDCAGIINGPAYVGAGQHPVANVKGVPGGIALYLLDVVGDEVSPCAACAGARAETEELRARMIRQQIKVEALEGQLRELLGLLGVASMAEARAKLRGGAG